MPPQYTVQLVGLDWLYTSSNVRGFELPGRQAQNIIRQLGITFLSPVHVLFGDLPAGLIIWVIIDYIF